MGYTENLDAYYQGKPNSVVQVMDRLGAAASDVVSGGVNAIKDIGRQAIVQPVVSGAQALGNYQNKISEGQWGDSGTAAAAPPPRRAIQPPPAPAPVASKDASGPAPAVNSSGRMNDDQIAASIRENSRMNRSSGSVDRPTAINSSNSYTDGDLPSVGQSVTGITPREAPDPNYFRNNQMMDDAMRASNIRYQTLNSVAAMIQDIQNRMGNNYGNRMDQAMSVAEGTKAINNLMSGAGTFGSAGREVEGAMKGINEEAEVGAKTAHYNQLAEDSRLNRAIEMGKLNETSRANQAREAIDTNKLGIEYNLGKEKVAADRYGHELSYQAGASKNEAAMNTAIQKNLPKITEDVDAELSQMPKGSLEDELKRAQDPKQNSNYQKYQGLTISQYRELRKKKMVNDRLLQARDAYANNPTSVNMAIISPYSQ